MIVFTYRGHNCFSLRGCSSETQCVCEILFWNIYSGFHKSILAQNVFPQF